MASTSGGAILERIGLFGAKAPIEHQVLPDRFTSAEAALEPFRDGIMCLALMSFGEMVFWNAHSGRLLLHPQGAGRG